MSIIAALFYSCSIKATKQRKPHLKYAMGAVKMQWMKRQRSNRHVKFDEERWMNKIIKIRVKQSSISRKNSKTPHLDHTCFEWKQQKSIFDYCCRFTCTSSSYACIQTIVLLPHRYFWPWKMLLCEYEIVDSG